MAACWRKSRDVTRSCFLTSTRSADIIRRFVGSSNEDGLELFHVTTPIYYVNAVPHMGHLYTSLLADAACRWRSLKGHRTKLVTGTDEHGLKIQKAATASQLLVPDYCDTISQKYSEMFAAFDINYTDFIRTTSPEHKTAVTHLWERLSGYLRKGVYSGWYCTSDETFLTDSQVERVENPQEQSVLVVSRESGQPCEMTTEENYLFPLHKFRAELTSWIDSNVITPPAFKSSLHASLETLGDLSVSRSSERMSWGIPVPNDPSQTIYVWLDALANYLTACGYPDPLTDWPPDFHIVGKDILKFHAIYWPAFLMAADLPLPKGIICHSHWTVNDRKMSKSIGNVVDPMQVKGRYGSDGLRYFLLREGVLGHDGNYSETKMADYLNSELSNTLGNLLSRCTSRAVNPDQLFPPRGGSLPETDEWAELTDGLARLPAEVEHHYESFAFYKGVDSIMAQLRRTNAYMEVMRPWKLKDRPDELQTVLHAIMENLRIAGILLQPIIPNLSCQLLDRLGVSSSERQASDARPASASPQAREIASGPALYSRVKLD